MGSELLTSLGIMPHQALASKLKLSGEFQLNKSQGNEDTTSDDSFAFPIMNEVERDTSLLMELATRLCRIVRRTDLLECLNEEVISDFHIELQDLDPSHGYEWLTVCDKRCWPKRWIQQERWKQDWWEILTVERKHLKTWLPPVGSVPISWNAVQGLADFSTEVKGFKVILADPPWQSASSSPTRGTTLSYQTATDNVIKRGLQINHIQEDGFLFVWAPVSRITQMIQCMAEIDRELVDLFTWNKVTDTGAMQQIPGQIWRNACECLLVFRTRG